MDEAVKILTLEIENAKRIQLVRMELSPTGLTVIGGDNCQGKTSVIDMIMFSFLGEKYRPTDLQHEGGMTPARSKIVLSNGLTVERTGKNATLKVTDPSGVKGGQKLLDSFIEELALNLPAFLNDKKKGAVLLRILGIGDQLDVLDKEERAAYQDREALGRIADQKKKYAAEMPEHHDVPEVPMLAGVLVAQVQAVMARNAERQARFNNMKQMANRTAAVRSATQVAAERVELARIAMEEAKKVQAAVMLELSQAEAEETEAAGNTVIEAEESTAAIEAQIADMEAINAKVRENLNKRKAIEDAEEMDKQYDAKTAIVEEVRTRRKALLDGAVMPLPGLSVEAGELTYNGKAWDCMSGMEQIRAGVAIVRKLKPSCGFVLLDKLEGFDLKQVAALGAWLEAEGLQAIATRVSKGAECSIIIEDGMVLDVQAEVIQDVTEKEEW